LAPRSGGVRNRIGAARVAVALIGRHGTAGASLADIGVEAGYSSGLPVQCFGTKLSLLETVTDTIQGRFMPARSSGGSAAVPVARRLLSAFGSRWKRSATCRTPRSRSTI
jgi:AcrR family transcriptional regulator